MYKKILVPLDGSKFAESSLEQSRGYGGVHVRSRFVMIIDPVSYFSIGELAAANTKMAAQAEMESRQAGKARAEAYIDEITKKLKRRGISAKSDIIFGRPES
jgi:nucleotide-binding universal stress UspA family protein